MLAIRVKKLLLKLRHHHHRHPLFHATRGQLPRVEHGLLRVSFPHDSDKGGGSVAVVVM